MSLREKALRKARRESVMAQIVDIESQLAKGWIETPPEEYERLLNELSGLW
jgi:hypothetical protein